MDAVDASASPAELARHPGVATGAAECDDERQQREEERLFSLVEDHSAIPGDEAEEIHEVTLCSRCANRDHGCWTPREERSMASDQVSRGTSGGTAKRRQGMINGNFTIGRFGGVEVRLNWSLIAVFALIVWSLAEGVFPDQDPGLSHNTYLAMAFVAAVLFLASILLHELGHSWVARHEGI